MYASDSYIGSCCRYSYGACLAAAAGARQPAVSSLVLVSPPIGMLLASGFAWSVTEPLKHVSGLVFLMGSALFRVGQGVFRLDIQFLASWDGL